jgi:polysaccharide pyruvyl transferase WcaK-like protein
MTGDQPMIGLNIRQWFHFTSSVLPYEFSRGLYRERSEGKMAALIDAFSTVIVTLRKEYDARILLFSAYQPEVVPWEDDLPWLRRLKQNFQGDPEVVLIESPLALPQYYQWMSSLDLMIGMRLHSSLTALRFGVPALNISYTLKGKDIYDHLGLSEHVLDLQDVMQDPHKVIQAADRVLKNLEGERNRVQQRVAKAVQANVDLLSELLGDSSFE